MNKILEHLQAEFRQDAETLATLQTIYAERVKQIRTNRALPPDIQERFLSEWEQFYNERVSDIFSYDSVNQTGGADTSVSKDSPSTAKPVPSDAQSLAEDFGIETAERRPQKKK
jgi:hypothetical protein